MTADTITAIKKALEGVTPGPWKAVSDAHFDSGLVYTSVQPVNVDEEAMKPMAMANGEFHVCRMSHTAAPWRFNYHRKNAQYIAAVNPEVISDLLSTLESLQCENERLQAEVDRKSSMPGDHRYWEGRYRDEAAANEKLRESLQSVRNEFRVEREGGKIGGISHDSKSLPRIIGIDTALSSTGDTHGN